MSRALYSGSRFRRALAFLLVGRAAQAAATLAFALLAIRAFGPTEYGAYMLILGIVEVCHPLSSLGLLPTVQQFLPEMALHARSVQLRRFVALMTALRLAALLVFAAGAYLFWPQLAQRIGLDAQRYAAAWVVCLLIVTTLSAMFTEAMLESVLEQRFVHTLRALHGLARLIGLVVLVASERVSVVHMLWIDIALSAVRWMVSEAVLVRQMGRLVPDGSRAFATREIVRFGWHMSGAQVLSAVAAPGALRVLVARALGVEVAGHFAFAQQLLRQATLAMPANWLGNVVRPMLIARHRSGEHGDVARAGGLLWKINFGLGLILVCGAAVGGNEFMRVLSGGRILEGGWLLTMAMSAAVCLALNMVSMSMLQTYRYSGVARRAALASLAVPLAVALGASDSLGLAAVGLAGGAALRGGFSLWLQQRQDYRTTIDWPGLARLAGAGVIAAAAGVLLAAGGLVPGLLVFVVVYLGAARLLRPINLPEFQMLQRIMARPLDFARGFVRPAASAA